MTVVVVRPAKLAIAKAAGKYLPNLKRKPIFFKIATYMLLRIILFSPNVKESQDISIAVDLPICHA